MENLMIYFLLFIIYSIFGWIMETVLLSIKSKKFINRGFLVGPYLPIYGTGALAILIFLKPYHDDFLVLFVMSVILCSIIEYSTSYIMEKIFKARWWDYSQLPFNINGRIYLPYSLAFGFMGSLIILVNNQLYNFLSSFPDKIVIILSISLFVIFIIDIIISFNIISKIELSAYNLRKDYSCEITEKVRKILENKSLLIKRLYKAFPNIKILQKKK